MDAGGVVGRLQHKIAIVTGAGAVGPGWGNGRATAVRFAQEGATVFAFDTTLDALAQTIELGGDASGEIVPVICDVTDGAQVTRVVQDCASRFGRLDVLVNNVGGPTPGGPVALSEADWDRQIELNLKSVFLMCKQVIPRMVAAGGGSIVNIASTSGIRYTVRRRLATRRQRPGIQLSRVAVVVLAAARACQHHRSRRCTARYGPEPHQADGVRTAWRRRRASRCRWKGPRMQPSSWRRKRARFITGTEPFRRRLTPRPAAGCCCTLPRSAPARAADGRPRRDLSEPPDPGSSVPARRLIDKHLPVMAPPSRFLQQPGGEPCRRRRLSIVQMANSAPDGYAGHRHHGRLPRARDGAVAYDPIVISYIVC